MRHIILISIFILSSFILNPRLVCGQSERDLKDETRQAEELYAQGLQLFNDHNYEKASSLFQRALVSLPNSAEIWNHLGTCFYNLQKYTDAEAAFTKAHQLDGTNIEILQNLALVFYKQQNFKEAFSSLEKILRIKPNTSQALYLMGHIYSQDGRFDEALQVYKKAAQINKKDARVYYLIGNIYYQRDELETAVEYYNKALRYNARMVNAAYNLANCYYKLGQFEEAVAYYEAGLQQFRENLTRKEKVSERHAKAFYNLGNIYFKKKTYPKALTAYEDALKIDPQFASSAYRIGLIYKFENEPDKAIQWLEKSLHMRDPEVSAHEELGALFSQTNQPERALEHFTRFEQVAPDSMTLELWLKIGNLHISLQSPGQAIKAFQKALAIDADNVDVLDGLAECFLHQNAYQKATLIYQRLFDSMAAKKREPQDFQRWNFALSLEHISDLAGALKEYQQLAEMNPMGLYRFHIGRIYRKMNNSVSALAEFEKALKYHWSKKPRSILKNPPPYFYCSLGQIYLEHDDRKAALKIFQKALKQHPHDYHILVYTANILYSAGTFGEAKNKYERALKSNAAGSEALFGLQLTNCQTNSGALSPEDIPLISWPAGPPAQYWLQRGHLLASLGHYQEAYNAYDRFGQVQPGDSQASWYQALCLAKMKRWKAAIEKLNMLTSLKIDPDHVLEFKQFVHFSLADTFLNNQYYSAARETFSQVLALNPNSILAANNIGYVAYLTASGNEATRYFTQAYQRSAQPSPELINNRVLALVIEGEPLSALALLEENPQLKILPAYNLNLGLLIMNLGHNELPRVMALWGQYNHLNGQRQEIVHSWINELHKFYYGTDQP
ncbi:tetratricopeptide repeat protein [candidate division CSSED10-310 bacterium]|uniref:Tetratricopeptide repeat protein n=1 Tax=candidate division CSSED10-310 bacterium TaxID=2855610 RepID=A0ABV6YYB0_UNCC1